jgi:hypothetical protein
MKKTTKSQAVQAKAPVTAPKKLSKSALKDVAGGISAKRCKAAGGEMVGGVCQL